MLVSNAQREVRLTFMGAFGFGGWFGGAVLLAFAVLGLILAGREGQRVAPAVP